MAPVPGRTLRIPLLLKYEVGQSTLMTLTGTSATTAAGSFSGNDPAHQDADGVHDCASGAAQCAWNCRRCGSGILIRLVSSMARAKIARNLT